MRQDARYVSPLRFMEELPSDEQHPLLLKLRDLHRSISQWELAHHEPPKARMYLPPFCEAIKSRDISASVTGAALHAIHKYLLYGFLNSEMEAFTTIANTLLLCTFEESGSAPAEESPRRNGVIAGANNQDDEQVVLKLLDLSALVVRCASQTLQPDIIVGLLDTCLHVSHRAKRASSLLKSAASDALGQIVLEVFSQPNLMKARVAILTKLASLLNPQKNSEAYVVNSLKLVNIALETLTDELSQKEISILQNNLCKFLLAWSTTHNLVILSLTMRVIFNLFQTIRNHLKVPLEVFLTSVHLRILEHSSSPEEREVAIESLLEFCQEPALMKDLYRNYDCDVNCTNLYASICKTLGNVAAPTSVASSVAVEVDKNVAPGLNGQNTTISQKAAAAAAEVPMNTLNVLALEGLLTIVESIARRVRAPNQPDFGHSFSGSNGSLDGDFLLDELNEEELLERKKEKASLGQVAKAFNADPGGRHWIEVGKQLGCMEEDPASIARGFFRAPGIDKNELGAYLGKGPPEKYPFEHKVRLEFVKQIDFTKHKSFGAALRLFLRKFRMPGEAQCIDRLMEAFSEEYFIQQGDSSVFKNSDAVFVLAFSTIMLNTDLHNPQNKTRMTCEQFVRNNRGLNDGEDLPKEMLEALYNQIKKSELQVQKEIGEFISVSGRGEIEHFRAAWGDLLSKNVEEAAFTSRDDALKTMTQVGVHDKDMFMVIAKPALKSISSALTRSWDDGCVVESLRGLEQMARVATYFEMDKLLNEIMSCLLSQGREFIAGCVSLELAGIDSGAPITQGSEDDESMSIVDTDSPVPHALLNVRELAFIDPKKVDLSGAAAYRGLLALHMGLRIVRTLFHRVTTAWPILISVLCSLRDARALPPGLADLDDFADSDGNVLPLSSFAQASQKKLDDYYRSRTGKAGDDKKGWFRLSFFKRDGKDEELNEVEQQPIPETAVERPRGQITANRRNLLLVAQRVEVGKLMVYPSNMKLPLVEHCIKNLLDAVDKFPQKDSPLYEQHTAFALELAVRALLADRDRAKELLPFFMPKFQSVASQASKYDQGDLPVPFLIERVVVTILRTSIHLFSNPEFRPKLKATLDLLPAFPANNFIRYIADRMACGLAIILRNSYYLFDDEWKFMVDTFDVLARFEIGRSLTFDGIASTIEFAVPQLETEDLEVYEEKLKETRTLSLQASSALQKILFRFMDGSYDGDYLLAVPAMLCLEKTYKHMVQLILIRQSKQDPDRDLDSVPDKELWHRVGDALYSVCASSDQETSKQGLESCQRHFMSIFMDEIPDEKWLAILNSMTDFQPRVKDEASRVNTLSLMGQMMIRLFPIMTKREANFHGLTEITKNVVIIADENMQDGSKPLFDLTAKIVTGLGKQISSPDFGGDKRYCKWASDTFLKTLKKNNVMVKKKKKKTKNNT